MEEWFRACFLEPTPAQAKGWPPILDGRFTLLLAPTGSGKTLAAFLAAIVWLLFGPEPSRSARRRVLYVSPLKALAVDAERKLRSPIAGISAVAERRGAPFRVPEVATRSGDTSAACRILGSVETVIVDEIHSLVPSKRGAHLALSLERLDALRGKSAPPFQRIGLSATQRWLEPSRSRWAAASAARSSSPRWTAVRPASRRWDLTSRLLASSRAARAT